MKKEYDLASHSLLKELKYKLFDRSQYKERN